MLIRTTLEAEASEIDRASPHHHSTARPHHLNRTPTMTNTIPHDHHHHRLRPHHQEMDHQLQSLAMKPQAKRQARRRTHTSRPYQERLLNMAEARREIVTALKIHRASTSTRHHHHQQQQQQQQSTYQHRQTQQPPIYAQQLQQQQDEEQKQVQAVAFQDRRIQAAAAVDEEASLSSHTTAMSYAAASWIAAAGRYCSPAAVLLPCDDLTPPPELRPPTAAAMGGLELESAVHCQYQAAGLERLVHSLPARPLGLNLSFQGFGVSVDDDDGEDFFGSLPLLGQPSSSPVAASYYSCSPPAVVETTAAATNHVCGHGSPATLRVSAASGAENRYNPVVIDAPAQPASLIPVVPADEQAASAAAGEMQGVEEWSEAVVAAADVAAWWSKIFESGQQRAPPDAEDGLPAEWRWLCGDDDVAGAADAEQGAAVLTGGVLATMMHVDDGDGDYGCCCYEGGRSDGAEDVTLPCMGGIGDDVQGLDGEEWSSFS